MFTHLLSYLSSGYIRHQPGMHGTFRKRFAELDAIPQTFLLLLTYPFLYFSNCVSASWCNAKTVAAVTNVKCCGKASEVLGRGCWLLRAEIHCIRLNRSKTDSWDAKVNWTNGSKGSLCSNSLFVDFTLFFFNLRRDFKIDTQLKIILKFPNAWDQTTEGLRLPVIQWL